MCSKVGLHRVVVARRHAEVNDVCGVAGGHVTAGACVCVCVHGASCQVVALLLSVIF